MASAMVGSATMSYQRSIGIWLVATLLVEVDVLDADLAVAKLCVAQAAFEPPVLTFGRLAIEEEAKPFGMAERFGFGVLDELLEGLGHAGEAELIELTEGWMKQHGRPLLKVIGSRLGRGDAGDEWSARRRRQSDTGDRQIMKFNQKYNFILRNFLFNHGSHMDSIAPRFCL